MRIAGARARLAFKQVRVGVTTAWGTVPRLVALVGAGTAARLLYTGCEINAPDAKRVGLVDEVTEDGRARETALAWASEIADGSPTAIAAMKEIVRASLRVADDVRPVERARFIDTWSGADHRDASEAWFERRPPRWSPR
jgi:enoyl-CoA hydratase